MDVQQLTDLITGKSTYSYYKKYRETQWYRKEQMEEYQLIKLSKLVKHCYTNVPYYTKIMKARRIDPNAVNSLDYLIQFPILTKEIIKDNYNLFTPTNSDSIRGIKTSPTGGTTGSILDKRNDANTRSSVWASYRRFYDWMGISSSDKILTYWGGHIIKHGFAATMKVFISNSINNTVAFDAYDTSPGVLDKISRQLSSGKISLIRSYPQALYILAQKLRVRGERFQLKAIMTTSEPLMPQHRDLFRWVFGCEAYDQYGCGEIGAIAYECSSHHGLHVTEERVILERNDRDELIITDLDNYTMPFLRYWNADQAEFSDEPCSCGRHSSVLKRILGRSCDYLHCENGETLHWAYFWHLLFDTEIAINRNFIKFQIVQKTPDHLLFRTVSDEIPQNEKVLLTNLIREKMGNVTVEFVREIDIENSPSGKFRPVINELISGNQPKL